MKRLILPGAVAFLLVMTVAAFAADVAGKWKAEFQTPNGDTRTSEFNFQVSGDTLTGTVSSPRGESKIQEGKVNGDEVSFVVVRNFNGDDVKISYKGKVTGNEMKLTVNFGGDREFEMTAKKQ